MDGRMEQGRAAYELGLRLGAEGPVAIGMAGGSLAQALARTLGCGVALAGGEARFHDGSCTACGLWLAEYYSIPAAVFIRQAGGNVTLTATDRYGNPIRHPGPRALPVSCTGRWEHLSGADYRWAACRAAGRCALPAATAEGPPALTLLLERMGCDVPDRPREGIPHLRADAEGRSLTVETEGRTYFPEGRDALEAAANWLTRGQAVPAFQPQKI